MLKCRSAATKDAHVIFIAPLLVYQTVVETMLLQHQGRIPNELDLQ